MELYKIITRGGKKHFYESRLSYDRGKKYHLNYLKHVSQYLGYLTVECYELKSANNIPYWRIIKIWRVVNGRVI